MLALYLSLIQPSILSKFSIVGGKGQDWGAGGGSSLLGQEHIPVSRPSQDLKFFISVLLSIVFLSTVSGPSSVSNDRKRFADDS